MINKEDDGHAATRMSKKTKMEMVALAMVAMVEFAGKHWPATFAGRPGTNEDDDGDGSGCGGNRSDGSCGCGGDERHYWPATFAATFAGRPGMKNTRSTGDDGGDGGIRRQRG